MKMNGIKGDSVLEGNEEAITYAECSECGDYTLIPVPFLCNRCFKRLYRRNVFVDDKLQKKE